MRLLSSILLVALLSGCATSGISTVGRLPDSTIDVHVVTSTSTGVSVGALAFVQNNQLVGVVGGAVDGGIAAALSYLGTAASAALGLVELEREHNARTARLRGNQRDHPAAPKLVEYVPAGAPG